ncbi:MAG TPA: hypothetical protein VGF25_21825 [Thermoleophilaceae bacterium]
MDRAHVDITRDLEDQPVVHALFDLGEEETGAAAHAVAAIAAERYRMADMSSDDVLQLRELTALADELGELVGGTGTLVMRPARLSALRDAVQHFVESRDEADWIREEDREPLAIVRGMLFPLEQLCAEAMRAALSPSPRGASY